MMSKIKQTKFKFKFPTILSWNIHINETYIWIGRLSKYLFIAKTQIITLKQSRNIFWFLNFNNVSFLHPPMISALTSTEQSIFFLICFYIGFHFTSAANGLFTLWCFHRKAKLNLYLKTFNLSFWRPSLATEMTLCRQAITFVF